MDNLNLLSYIYIKETRSYPLSSRNISQDCTSIIDQENYKEKCLVFEASVHTQLPLYFPCFLQVGYGWYTRLKRDITTQARQDASYELVCIFFIKVRYMELFLFLSLFSTRASRNKIQKQNLFSLIYLFYACYFLNTFKWFYFFIL